MFTRRELLFAQFLGCLLAVVLAGLVVISCTQSAPISPISEPDPKPVVEIAPVAEPEPVVEPEPEPRKKASTEVQKERDVFMATHCRSVGIYETKNKTVYVNRLFHNTLFRDRELVLHVIWKWVFDLPDGETIDDSVLIVDGITNESIGYYNGKEGLVLTE
jgi:hypothetical protein